MGLSFLEHDLWGKWFITEPWFFPLNIIQQILILHLQPYDTYVINVFVSPTGVLYILTDDVTVK